MEAQEKLSSSSSNSKSTRKKREELEEEFLTESERKFRKRELKSRSSKLSSLVSKSHRERVDDFNQSLDSLPEHNDIPRVSAAGNG